MQTLPVSFDPQFFLVETAQDTYRVQCCGCHAKRRVVAHSATFARKLLVSEGWREWLAEGWECPRCQIN